MTTTSATGGYLAPISAGPAADDALEDQIQAAIVGITALSGKMVRPAWQPNPPAKEDLHIDWCAYRVVAGDAHWTPSIVHHPDGEGTDEVTRQEEIEVLASFYGPAAYGLACRLRDGLSLPQNQEALRLQGFGFVEASRIWAAPEFVNNQWVRRQDLRIKLARSVSRTYPVRNLLSAEGVVSDEAGNTNTWNTENT